MLHQNWTFVIIHYCSKFEVSKIECFSKECFLLSKRAFIKVVILWNIIIEITVLSLYFKMKIIPVMAKLYFQHHYSSLQCYMILQKSFYDDLTLKKFSYYYHCWKQLCCFKFFRILCLWIECSREQQLKCIALNAWIWLADKRSEVCNYFQKNARRT